MLGLGAVAVHRLARREIGSDAAALLLALAWLLNPALGHLTLFEYHPEALSTTALLFGFLALREGRLRRALIWSALALLGKEDVALVVGMMGLYAWTLPRAGRLRTGAALIGLAAAALALNLLVLKPMFAAGGGAEYGLMYREWGSSAAEIARHVATHPLHALGALAATAGDAFDTHLKRTYWLELLLPFGFAALAAPLALLIPLPIWLEHFLSWRYPQHAILNQYTALVLPFIAAATVIGVARIARMGKRGAAPAVMLAAVVCVAAAAGQWLYGPFRAPARYWSERVWPTPEDLAMQPVRERMIARVPERGGVIASSDVLVRFALRDSVHAANHLLSGLHTFSTDPYPLPGGIGAALVDVGRERGFTLVNERTSRRWRGLMRENDLVPVDAASDVVLFLRAPELPLPLVTPDTPPDSMSRVTYLEGVQFLAARIAHPDVERGAPVRFSTWWRRFATPSRFLMTQLVVVDRKGKIADDRVRFLGYTIAPPGDWARGVAMREDYRLVLPAGLGPGSYTLGMRVWVEDSPPAPAATEGDALAASSGFVRLGAFTLETSP